MLVPRFWPRTNPRTFVLNFFRAILGCNTQASLSKDENPERNYMTRASFCFLQRPEVCSNITVPIKNYEKTTFLMLCLRDIHSRWEAPHIQKKCRVELKFMTPNWVWSKGNVLELFSAILVPSRLHDLAWRGKFDGKILDYLQSVQTGPEYEVISQSHSTPLPWCSHRPPFWQLPTRHSFPPSTQPGTTPAAGCSSAIAANSGGRPFKLNSRKQPMNPCRDTTVRGSRAKSLLGIRPNGAFPKGRVCSYRVPGSPLGRGFRRPVECIRIV